MFDRFTDRARRVIVLAQDEARMLNHNYIGTEHILLGLIHEGEGVAAKALEQLEISLDAVREQVKAWKQAGLSVGYVPTMGFLHEGHASLMKQARQDNDKVVVSIFVNPTQFGPTEDLDSYPRDLDHDSDLCESMGVDLIFHPEPSEMYVDPKAYVNIVGLSDHLCGATRPIHFKGVCTVVSKFFNIVTPDRAYFGQKDAQQVMAIKAMVRDLNVPCGIEVVPTVRDADGLALSSRNVFLSPEQRSQALA